MKKSQGAPKEFIELKIPLGFPGPFPKMKMHPLVIFKNEKEILISYLIFISTKKTSNVNSRLYI